jgi:hypothetical protein
MKSQIKILFALFSLMLIFQNCKKENLSKISINKNGIRSKNQIASVSTAFFQLNTDDYLTVYNSLTNDEIKNLWIQHIEELVSNRTLTSAQLLNVDLLKTYITNADLDNVAAKNNFVSVWLPNSLNVFSEKEVYLLAFTLYNDINTSYESFKPYVGGGSGGGGTPSTPKKSCQCELGSNFWACALHPKQCDVLECTPNKGCGFLMLSECNGRCNLLQQ